ncbi:hypothetical protein [Phaeovulum sp. W22_SRMD_FR3]|uniref:hypothetical protein n=1 Tax=Phaeovulum sp. W22_SRMD_FR3 TaxID=3240274 RepID=UPI003F9B630B
MTRKSDAIDRAAGLAPEGAIHALRRFRPEFVDGAEACRAAVLSPEEALGLSEDLRQAVAYRAARGAENPALLGVYRVPEGADLATLARGETPADPALAALARHADMIAARPAEASGQDLAMLQAAGFTVPQIIALSELLAYVCFQIRVAHGLALMEAAG